MNQEDGGTRSTRPTLLHWSHHWSHPSSPKHRIGKTTMAEPAQGKPQPPPAVPGPAAAPAPRRRHGFRALRAEIPAWQGVAMGILCIVVCLGVWWSLTAGDENHSPIIGPEILPSPATTFAAFPTLWFERELTRNLLVSLKRVVLGFALAAVVGVPLGVVCGCFRRINAFFGPLVIIGRNVPVAAVIPLTFALFGIGEFQKVMFIFIACVAFIVMDTANSIVEVDSRYVDTAYTLGAGAGKSSSRSSCRSPCPAFSTRYGSCSAWPSATSC